MLNTKNTAISKPITFVLHTSCNHFSNWVLNISSVPLNFD